MARETKEERILREAHERARAEDALEKYLASVPKRLNDAHIMARNLGISVNVKLTEDGPSVHFRDEKEIFNDTLTYQTEEWELESLERKLRELNDENVARAARVSMAQEVFATLSKEQKAAIKENIYMLR
jgi:hypothetical protein